MSASTASKDPRATKAPLDIRFPPELRTASITPRWSIVWTLTQDYLSNHCFFVGLYAREIARMIGWKGDYGDLAFVAALHDVDETITGDITGPAKDSILDKDGHREYVHRHLRLRMPHLYKELQAIADKDPMLANEMQTIVHVADKLDALFFLLIEQRLGNTVVEVVIRRARASLVSSWGRLPLKPYNATLLKELWDTHIESAIKAHLTTGGFGI